MRVLPVFRMFLFGLSLKLETSRSLHSFLFFKYMNVLYNIALLGQKFSTFLKDMFGVVPEAESFFRIYFFVLKICKIQQSIQVKE